MTNICAFCHKSGTASTLKYCAKCKTTPYCSRDCQKSHWSVHKKTCDRGASSASIQVHAIDAATMQSTLTGNPLANLPEAEVYKRLIDSYRLRVEDELNFNGEVMGVYANADPVVEFESFLKSAEMKGGILPAWWSEVKRGECVTVGKGDEKGWSWLGKVVGKPDVQAQYGDHLMPMKLRMLAENIYGRGVMR